MSESGNGRFKPRRKATRAASRGSRSGAARPTPAESTPPTPPEPPRYAPRTSDESPFWATAQSAGAANQSPFWANAQSTPGAGTPAPTTTPAAGGGERGGSRAAARSAGGRGSGARRPLIAIASVLLVITPISWILLHEPQNDDAEASIPIVTRTDDAYVTPTIKPVVNPPSSKVSTPPASPTATPTQTPTNSVTPTTTPSTTDPTDAPTSKSTDGPITTPDRPTPTPDRTTASRPTAPPTTNDPPPRPPARDGGMKKDESRLFDLIDEARVANGCAPLEQDPDLTDGARADAEDRSTSADTLNASGSSMTAAGGDEWSPQQAYDQMMAHSRSTVLNCNLKTLGVGKGVTSYCTRLLCVTGRTDRVSWVADFT